MASGEIFNWLNSDDWFAPGALKKVGEIFVSDSAADVVVGTGDLVTSLGKIVLHREPPSEITLEMIFDWLNNDGFIQPSTFFTRSVWQEAGPIDEQVNIAFDLDLWIRIAQKGYRFVTIPDLLSLSLKHDKAKTTAYSELTKVDSTLVIARAGGERFVRRSLEDMAMRLAWCEPNFLKIIHHPLFRLLEPVALLFVKPAIRWTDVIPFWLRKAKNLKP